ncbi:moxd1 [Scenedesmus sp. PABB004]|nr:moxd1 [Scenedesmus sp. PABB004]
MTARRGALWMALALVLLVVARGGAAAAAPAAASGPAAAAAPAPRVSCADAASALAAAAFPGLAALPFCVELGGRVALRWGIAGGVATFGVHAVLPADTAYLGIGLSQQGSMRGADVALLNRTAGGWALVDAFAPDFVAPTADAAQDLRLVGLAARAGGALTAAWRRAVAPCDARNLPLGPAPLHVLWAYGPRFGYHGRASRGGVLVDLRAGRALNAPGSAASVAGEPGLRTLELKLGGPIPAQRTTYLVQYFTLPADREYHVLRYEPIVGSPLLHHGVLYSCAAGRAADGVAAALAAGARGPYDRFSPNFTMACENFYMLLASNMTGWTAPPNAGLPMGTPNRRLVALELHFDNPEGLADAVDSGSGIRVYYAPKAPGRDDVGLITLQQPVLNIPPGQAAVPSNVSVCPAECTSRLPRSGVALLDVFFHMHGLGAGIEARHFRGGVELEPIGSLRSWDYNFQGNAPLTGRQLRLLPGDDLTLRCVFDSRARTNVTRSGFATSDEMCFAWLSVVPAPTGDAPGLCYSFGGRPVAVCGAEPEGLYEVLARRDASVLRGLVGEGKLLVAPDPTATSKPYKEACSAKPPARRVRAAAAAGAAAAGLAGDAAAHLPQHRLPNGLVVRHASTAAEVAFLFDEAARRTYLRHGVAVRRGGTVLDVGANIGLAAMAFAVDAGSGGRVVALEPAPAAAAALAANLRAHAELCAREGRPAPAPVTVLAAAAGDGRSAAGELTVFAGAAGWSTLRRDDAEVLAGMEAYLGHMVDAPRRAAAADDDAGWSPAQRALVAVARRLARAPPLRPLARLLARLYVQQVMLRGASCVRVPLVSLSDVIDGQGLAAVDLLKVDVERAELEVLRGVQPRHWPRIRQVALEVHDVGGQLAAVLRLLRESGGFAHVVVEQDAQLAGSSLFNVYARR